MVAFAFLAMPRVEDKRPEGGLSLHTSICSSEWASIDSSHENNMAVRVGFEPTVPVKVRQFSRLLDSTTLAPHRMDKQLKL